MSRVVSLASLLSPGRPVTRISVGGNQAVFVPWPDVQTLSYALRLSSLSRGSFLFDVGGYFRGGSVIFWAAFMSHTSVSQISVVLSVPVSSVEKSFEPPFANAGWLMREFSETTSSLPGLSYDRRSHYGVSGYFGQVLKPSFPQGGLVELIFCPDLGRLRYRGVTWAS